MNNYLIPANSKKGRLILGFFRPFDLMLFGCGIGLTMLLLGFVSTKSIYGAIIVLFPILFTGLLVMPVPHYHNVLIVIKEGWQFLRNRQKYVWKGWCVNGKDDK